jgi:hypothetical protein
VIAPQAVVDPSEKPSGGILGEGISVLIGSDIEEKQPSPKKLSAGKSSAGGKSVSAAV